jgi:DNA-binding IclR family transcriptional regulator
MTLMSQEERMRVFDLHPLKHFTDETVTDQETYLMICDRVGKEGYAYTKNQTVSGVAGLSVPVLDPVGHLRGVISVSGPSFRFTEEIAKRESEKVMKIAKNFGNQLL